MPTRLVSLSTCLGALLIVVAVCTGNPPTAVPVAPRGFVLIEEQMWIRLADEPAHHLKEARVSFVAKDFHRAAADIRKSAVYIHVSANSDSQHNRAALSASSHELDQLARRVEAGSVKSVNELDAASARAQHALAKYHYALASAHLADERPHQAGQYLRMASLNLEEATARTEKTIKEGAHEVAAETRVISGKLASGASFVKDEVAKGFERLGKSIDNTGRDIWSGQPREFNSVNSPNAGIGAPGE